MGAPAPWVRWLVPEIDFGPYVLVRRLAVGGMGEVYLARRRGSGPSDNLVVKQMLPQLADDPSLVQLFLDEARIASNLAHPGIVHILDFGQVEGTFFIALEHVDGVDLAQLLHGVRPDGLGQRHAARIAIDVGRALHFAHEARDRSGVPLEIVHRDISPHNVLLSRSGTVHLTDFGIARARIRAARTTTGVLRGKLAYVAPERFQGGEGDRRVDVWALGVVAFEAAAGVRPFDGEPLAIIDGVLRQRIPRLTDRFAGFDAPFSDLVARAMARASSDRFTSCGELADALEALGIASDNVELGELVAREADRRKARSDTRQPTQSLDATPDLEDTDSLEDAPRTSVPRVITAPKAVRHRAAELANEEVTKALDDPSEAQSEMPGVSPLDVLALDEIGPPTVMEVGELPAFMIDGTPIGPPPPTPPPKRRRVLLVATGATVGLTVVSVGLGLWLRSRPEPTVLPTNSPPTIRTASTSSSAQPAGGPALPALSPEAPDPPPTIEKRADVKRQKSSKLKSKKKPARKKEKRKQRGSE
ncbi:MAG: serine/threonine protein kinase [Deltaproteobacteria bacterium]|nr:serine/threonine protein kinase [Deltaproteobacteria bacterium]